MKRRPIELWREAQEAVKKHGSVTAAAKALGVPRTTLSSRLKEAEAAPVDAGDEALRERVKTLEAMLRAQRRDSLSDEYIKRHIFKIAESPVEPPRWLVSPSVAGEPGVPVTLWSDWHWSEVVLPEEVNGVNEFNLEIAHRRLQRLVSGTIDLLTSYTVHKHPYPGIVVCLGGDMISGDIHEELSQTNERPVMPTLIDLVGKLKWAIGTLADHFGRVFVPAVVGNHGRTGRRPRFAGRAWTNYDWLAYQFLAKLFENDSRVKFLIGDGADVLFSVYGHRYLLTHGDTLGKGGDGIIGHFGNVIRGANRRAVRNQAVGQEFDTLLVGHFHSCTITPRFIVNGSLVGPGAFSHTLSFPFEKPQQALWLTHPTKGITISMPVFLEDGNPTKTNTGNWVSWTA